MDAQTRLQLSELMVRLADGDRSVFDAVYSALWPIVSAFCGKTLTHDDAEDATQQVLLKVFSQAANFERTRDAVTWALTIAAWEVRTIRRRHQRTRTSDLDESEHSTHADSPETLTAERQITDAAIQVLGQLSPADQQTLIATFNDDVTAGVAAATMRKRRERAMARLRDAWRRIYAG